MADEVPVCDVLCEAMEYLSKLGSNLRSRSENLKEKRIRKDKLKNYHAVQKAADKVLLICQLSKKSLENVECGVRKVLTLMNAGQESTAKTESETQSSSAAVQDEELRHFKYRSYKLKISKKVPVKHYLSARVLAPNMTLSMHEKYPVFHNCKLYRARKRKEREGIRESIEDPVCSNNGIDDKDDDDALTKNTDAKVLESPNRPQEISNEPLDSPKRSNSSNGVSDNKVSLKSKNDDGALENDRKSKELHSDSNMSDDHVNTGSAEKLTKKSAKRLSKSSRRSILDSDDEHAQVKKNKSTLKRIQVIDDDDSSDNNVDNVDKSETETLKKIEENKSVNNCDSFMDSNSKKPEIDASGCVSEANIEDITNAPSENENPENKTTEERIKPLIKCVNINQLLKPDILENTKQSGLKKSSTKKSKNSAIEENSSINKENINRSKTKRRKKSSESDEDFWVQKRKEVSAFVSKKFIIKVTRLPELSESFLNIHNLKKIIKDNKIVFEIGNQESTAGNLFSKKSCKSPPEQISVVKNALLNDSDSEKSDLSGSKSPLPLAEIEKTINNVLNNDTDISRNITRSPFTELEETVKKVLSESFDVQNETVVDAQSGKNCEKSCKDAPDPVKNALLNDSDSEPDKNDKNKEKEDIQHNDDSHKTKSDNLKQTLLAESDSESVDHNKSRAASKDQDNNSTKELSEKDENEGVSKSHNDKTQNETQSKLAPNKDNKDSKTDADEISPSKRKKHKRKNIMESMHAKKMLLTYSSSSDTEDEQLRNALKEIKDSLLKGVSSSDDEKKNKEVEKSSSEDDDILKDIRKKRKRESQSDHNGQDDVSKNSTDNEKKNETDQSSRSSRKSGVNSKSKKMGRSRAQPGGSSQNSDSQDPNDKDIDGLTNLNNLTKNRRRHDSTSTNTTDTNSIKKSTKMAKTPLISEENMLKAESSSEASAAESDPGEGSDPGEELPSISLTMNGSGVEHLAKDDLLDESDTSVSHKGDSDDIKKTDDSDEEAVKSKRRKAQLISSDSEAGSSRRKVDKTSRLSDFEDSEDDGSEPAKRSKRKKKGEESDASAGSSSNDGSKKKRRRIKQLDSEGSGSDTENEGRNKHGRKNIRKVMGKNQLEEATKKAAREEKERTARIAERQKLYNNLEFDESGKPDEVVLEKVVLDFDPETKEPLIQVDRGLVKKLKPHQANGIKFMWDACFESAKRIKKDRGSGCILAHCMGLGKTLQVVSLTHTLLTHSALTSVRRVLVVCPLSTVLNWVNEFNMWLKHADTDYDVDVYELSRHKQNSERAFQLQQWFEGGGVCVLGYEMFRNLSADNPKKFKKKMLRHFQESLVDPGPDLVVCDEGHLLKNEKTSLSQSMNRVKTRRRIVLTGTPLQNNLKEYYCMVQFVKPNLLGKYNEYLNRFVNPITNGQYTDSTEHDIRIMKRRSHVLHKMLDGAVQRRDYGVLAPFLPPKHEYVLFITLTDVQVKLYQFYLDNYSRRPLPGKSSGFLFPDFQSLQRIWTHPLVLKYNSERYEIMQQKKREREEEDSEGSLVDFIDDDSTPDESSTEESSDDLSDLSDDSRKKSKKKKSAKKSKAKETKVSTRRGTRANPVEMDEEEVQEVVELKNENPTEWWIKLVEEDELEDMRNSHKLVLLFDILRQCEAIGDKLLVFSQSLYSLDLIEHFLGKVDEATQEGRIDEKLGGHVGSWSPGVDYFRLDGSTSCENRSIWCKNFNREDNPRARLFLISTRAGGLGINLVAANRVVIFDVSWNPSHDVQSIFRVYRFGQKKPCYIYRFLAMGTMEEKIYERQVTKQAISKRVIDEQQIDRHYAENDLAELYKFEASPPVPRPIPPLPKDRLFAEMLREHEAQIYKYHEHDSLLENKEEETLSEEERKAAWEDFENEKNRPPPQPFPSAWPMHNGMVPGLLAQQQQQLAYAALAAMLRKDMPNINDNQIRDMIPLIYNANPALMQKMSEIYKYTQPGMMNPMMNPIMNAAAGGGGGGGGAGMGGTSGLQYEPPWQRQHQQQQQMRLQQLMQQNQMGAKYYAGGLGSRDPVAMALQQQRAREIMSGERGRPRGRPPLTPRAPPPASHADVVNLDSD